jgi:hypothetical protein
MKGSKSKSGKDEPKEFIFKGEIQGENSNPLSDLRVRAWDKNQQSDKPIGEAITDKNGRFKIAFRADKVSMVENKNVDLIIEIFDQEWAILGQKEINFNTKSREIVSFVLPHKLMKKRKYKSEEWVYSPEGIDYALETGRDLVPPIARVPLVNALSLLPKDIIDFVVENCIFISPEGKNPGYWYSFSHPFFKGKKGFILLG